MSVIQRDILPSIFSYLELNDLGNVASVCKDWNEAQKTDQLWKNKCLAYLDQPEPYQGSFKGRCKIIHNWMAASAEVNAYPPSFKAWNIAHDFVILDNNTPYEVYSDNNNLSTYTTRNCSTGETVVIGRFYPLVIENETDRKDDNNAPIVSSDLCGNIWSVLTSQGEFFYFNIEKGECIQESTLEQAANSVNKPDLRSSIIKHNGDEIIIGFDKKINIWNVNTGFLEQTLDASMRYEIWSVNSTANFIICSISNAMVIGIKKSDGIVKQLTSRRFIIEKRCIANSGPYVAILSCNGSITIFKDTTEDLTFINSFSVFCESLSNRPASICMYHNWLYVNKFDHLSVWNIHNGQKISHIQHNEPRLEFRTNGVCLLTRIEWLTRLAPTDPFYKREYVYTLYNFERNITQINAPKNPPKAPKKKCSLM